MLNKLEKIRADRAKTGQKGFTIIEVMIVLAIAGLILVIVLLAVPALQRNARNTTIKSDANTIGGGIATYESDNQGTTVTYIAPDSSAGLVDIGTGAADTNLEKIKISSGTTVVAGPVKTAPTSKSAVPSGTIWYQTAATCDGSTSARSVAVYFSLETSGGLNPQCVQG